MQAVVGVDPHKRVFSAVAIDERGGRLGKWTGGTTRQAIGELRVWANEHAPGAVWAIESTNSWGRRLAVALAEAGADVRDVCPTRTAERRSRRPGRGKSDAIDAEAIARELLEHPDLPHAFKGAQPGQPDPQRDALAVLVRARKQVVDRHRRLLNEAEPLLTELPAAVAERLPVGRKIEPRLVAAARLRRTGARPTDLRLQLLRDYARQERDLARQRDALELEIAQVLKELATSLPSLFGLGPLGAAELVVEVGDPRRFRSGDAFASYTGTAPIPASSAELDGRPVHHRLNRHGNRRLGRVPENSDAASRVVAYLALQLSVPSEALAEYATASRAGIELIRGSASDNAFETLLQRGLAAHNQHQDTRLARLCGSERSRPSATATGSHRGRRQG
ncbi:MAG: IS110 family transposase [Chloroflexota bacterium]